MQLYEALSMHVATRREENYMHDEFPAIAEILEWARQPDVPNFRLRAPQLRALETYWYLRPVEETPHIFDLYQSLFPKKKTCSKPLVSRMKLLAARIMIWIHWSNPLRRGSQKGRDRRGQGDGYAGGRSAGGEIGVERMRRWPIRNR